MRKLTLLILLMLSACSSNISHTIPYIDTFNESYYIQKAIEKYGDAENSNVGKKINRLGIMYENGFGVPPSLAKAQALWLKAGRLGYGNGYCNVAMDYMDDVKTYKKVKYYYQLATLAQEKSFCGYRGLGHVYYSGYSVKPDLKKAKDYYLLAIQLGDDTGESEKYLSLIAKEMGDYEAAQEWSEKAKEKGIDTKKSNIDKLKSLLEL
ncbi:hypothetical protein A4G19_11320 [Pasteurellaceae bacterium Macca]|nr:hypothetical protein [Pasteurellaceae bacterium Macca]